jgi:hypothetical protein
VYFASVDEFWRRYLHVSLGVAAAGKGRSRPARGTSACQASPEWQRGQSLFLTQSLGPRKAVRLCSHIATLPLPACPGNLPRTPAVWGPGSPSHTRTCSLLSNSQTSSTASLCRPHLALTGGETSSRLGPGTHPPFLGSEPSSVRHEACPLSPQFLVLSDLIPGGEPTVSSPSCFQILSPPSG